MKVARTYVKAAESQSEVPTLSITESKPVDNKFQDIQALLLQAVERLAEYSAEDSVAAEAIANLSVVLLDLNS